MDSTENIIDAVKKFLPSIRTVDADWAVAYERAIANFELGVEVQELPRLLQLARYPVSVDTFLFDPFYLGKKEDEIYPEVKKELTLINNPNGLRVVNIYNEAVFTGGIGSAKSTTALYTMAYQLYVLSCFRNPHEAFSMDSSSEILFIFQSKDMGLAQSVDYERFYQMIKKSTYFNSVFPYDTRIKKRLVFTNRIEVKAVGLADGALGQNVFGALIDEINFMAMVSNSKRTKDSGVYDEAALVYAGLSRRRKTRFQEGGTTPGILCLVSSKKYPDEFTDRKIEEAKTDKSIYVYDKCVWDIKPKGTYNSGFFKVYCGNGYQRARIITELSPIMLGEEEYIKEVPEDYRKEFDDDLMGALRDIAGVSVLAKFPYFSNAEKVVKCFSRTSSVITQEYTDLSDQLEVNLSGVDFTQKRWVHIDLGVTSDAAGICCGYVPNFKQTSDGFFMPVIKIDFILRVTPPKNGEIKFYRIREILSKLRDAGLPITWISFDSYQSVDSIQILRQKGFVTGVVSMDKAINPYAVTKTAINEGLIDAPKHSHCVREMLSLEYIATKGKVDHPPHSSKDLADAVAGVVYGLTTRRDIWAQHGVRLHNSVSALKEINTIGSNDE